MNVNIQGRGNGFFPGLELARHGGGGGAVKILFFVNICAISIIYKSIETYKSILYNT